MLQKALDFPHARRQFLAMAQALNEKQADLLRFLTRQSDPVPTDDLDGRIIRALKLRECIVERNGRVSVTEEGPAAVAAAPTWRRPPATPARRPSAAPSRRWSGHCPARPRWPSATSSRTPTT